jgi:hypothetical protein
MNVLWLVAGAALVMALVAWRRARAAARRLDQLSQMYWELKYQYGELRLHLQQLTSSSAPVGPSAGDGSQMAQPAAFVPLSSLRK